jgi:2-polyprenyl-6-methoxyphenol hydroxylase-like FAD-dependent oxidoreductase
LFGVARTFGMWPLPGGRTYWVATRAAAADPRGTRVLDKRGFDEVKSNFADAPSPVTDLLDNTDDGTVLQTPVLDRDPLMYWRRGRVVLIGDAAHPMQPTTGQGAAHALLDAVALAYELGTADLNDDRSLTSAVNRFIAVRAPSAVRAVRDARGIGQMQHVGNGAAALLRNTVLRATPARVWQKRAEHDAADLAMIARAGSAEPAHHD